MDYEWDPHKAKANHRKHGIHFADAVAVFKDEHALWREDEGNYGEDRFVVAGTDYLDRIVTVVFTFRGDNIRIISARKATNQERKTYGSRKL